MKNKRIRWQGGAPGQDLRPWHLIEPNEIHPIGEWRELASAFLYPGPLERGIPHHYHDLPRPRFHLEGTVWCKF